jgi:hypothetical protein
MSVEPLDQLAPPIPWEDDWRDVLARAGTARKRRVLVAGLALAAVLIPLVALAAVNDWWFLGLRDIPQPVDKVVVVTQGSWDGHPWKLVAYNSQGGGTCWSVTFDTAETGGSSVASGAPGGLGNGGSALSCGSVVGVHLPHIREILPTVAYLMGSNADGTIHWIAGPVVDDATSVRVVFDDGTTLRLPTVEPPSSLGQLRWFGPVRFYVGQLPPKVGFQIPLHSITGFTARGKRVACVIYGPHTQGYPRPTDCPR